MKNLFILFLFSIISVSTFSQCDTDTCQYKMFYHVNSDTSKWSSQELHLQGFSSKAFNNTLGYISVLSHDSYYGTFKAEGSWDNGNGNNTIGFNKPYGIAIGSTFKVTITSPLIVLTVLPTNCTGKQSGTVYKDANNFLKVCP